MEIKECYRVLELEVGASREAVETAYCRLLERWHPDRIKPAGDPAAIQEANRMVQQINEAYRTLDKIAPVTAKPPVSAPPANTPPPSTPKPTSTPPPPPPAPAPKPAPAPRAPEPAPATVVRAEPEPAPTGRPKDAWSPLDAVLAKFPPGSAARKYGPIGLAAVVVLILLLCVTMCSSKPTRRSSTPSAPDPKTTGSLVIKTNRPDTSVEATRVPDAQSPAADTFRASGAEPTFPGLPAGKYTVVAKSAGWPDLKQETTVVVGQAGALAVHFQSGSLKLDSVPSGATVRWGENELGKTPLTIPALPVGEIPLTLVLATWPNLPFKATIAEGTEASQTVHFPFGRLVVETTPAGATVQLEARVVGKTPLTLDQVPAGVIKVTLRADDYTPVAFNVTVEDHGEAKLTQTLVSSIPVLDPPALLAAVWVETAAEDPNRLAPGFRDTTGYQSRNGIVKNLNRKKLVENWLAKRFRFTGTVKSYDRDSGKIDFIDATNDLAKYHVTANLSISSRQNKEVVAQLTKGATFSLLGKLDAVEEPRWPAKTISIEIISADPQK